MIILNPKIKEIADEHNLNVTSCYLSLLYLYFKLQDEAYDDFFNTEVSSLSALGIIDYDYSTNDIKWLIPLFNAEDNENKEWDWVLDMRQLFRNIRKDAGGTPKACITKMQKFFVEHPSVRAEDCIEAAKMYLSTINDPKYLQRCDYFISKKGSINTSRLEEYLDIVKEQKENQQQYKINVW